MRIFEAGTNVLGEFSAGQDITALGGTFTRATTATWIDRMRRVQTAIAGELRDKHDMAGEGGWLLEPARTQLLPAPQTPASWADFGVPAITTGFADPWGGNAAIMVSDTDAINRVGKLGMIVFTADDVKSAVVVVRQGTGASIGVALRDSTLTVDRHAFTATWNAGDAPPTLDTTSGSGMLAPPVRVVDVAGNTWWMLGFAANGVIAANAHQLVVVNGGSVGAAVGTFYLAGGNAWNARFPTSWQPELGHVRDADILTFPHAYTPRALTMFVDAIPQGASNNVDLAYGIPTVAILGRGIGGTNNLHIRLDAGTADRRVTALHNTVSGSQVTSVAPGATVYGSRLRMAGRLYSDGSVQVESSINGAASVTGTRSAAYALQPAWGAATIEVGHTDTSVGGWWIKTVRVLEGAYSLADAGYDYLAATAADSAEYVHLVEFDFSGGAVRVNTGAHDLAWGGYTWEAIGGLLEIGGIEETADAKGQGVDFKLSGVEQTILAVLLTNDYRGRPVAVYRAHLNRTTGQVVGAQLRFQGLQLSPYTVEEDRTHGGGTVRVSTRISGYFGIDRVRGIQTNLVSHQHHFAGDTFFQHAASLSNQKVYWGTRGSFTAKRRDGTSGGVPTKTHPMRG